MCDCSLPWRLGWMLLGQVCKLSGIHSAASTQSVGFHWRGTFLQSFIDNYNKMDDAYSNKATTPRDRKSTIESLKNENMNYIEYYIIILFQFLRCDRGVLQKLVSYIPSIEMPLDWIDTSLRLRSGWSRTGDCMTTLHWCWRRMMALVRRHYLLSGWSIMHTTRRE